MATEEVHCPASVQQSSLQLTDVYEIAEKVGEQFQHLISQFGPTQLSALITAVVIALEHLESLVQENASLQISSRKLMLKTDSLRKEREEQMRLASELEELQYKLETERHDKKRMELKMESLLMKNEDLAKQLNRLQGTALKPVAIGQDPLNSSDSVSIETPVGEPKHISSLMNVNSADILQLPRMSRRLSQVDDELQKTRRKLVETHHSLQEKTADNRALKAQLEDSRAEAALRGLETLRPGSESLMKCSSKEPPKFYKQDLLAVLRERNELKEELDKLRDELFMTKLELKQAQDFSHDSLAAATKSNVYPGRKRASTRVREILDSITESVQVSSIELKN